VRVKKKDTDKVKSVGVKNDKTEPFEVSEFIEEREKVLDKWHLCNAKSISQIQFSTNCNFSPR
jgi:hypothetical protein